jgi:hypothetical protein
MLNLIDSGCGQHHPRQITCTGATATLMDRLLLNLPMTDGGYNYICEHGHTHRLTLLQSGKKVASYPQKLGFGGSTASAH